MDMFSRYFGDGNVVRILGRDEMDTFDAFIMGEINRHKELMIFDWNTAAEIIRENKPAFAVAGLQGDLEWTAGTIYKNGNAFLDDYTFLASTWATPVIILDEDGDEIPCFKMEGEHPGWNSDTKWPMSSLEKLYGVSKEELVKVRIDGEHYIEVRK